MNNLYQISEYRRKEEKKKFDFKTKKDNTIRSLKEVEYLLNNFNKFSNCFKLHKILKK